MAKNPFMEQEPQPTTQALTRALGGAYPAFEAVCLHAAAFAQSWAWAKYSGWVLKAAAKGKALFYLIPGQGAFGLSMALREAERDTLADNPELAFAREVLLGAKLYKEGYAVRFEVSEVNAGQVLAFVDALILLRP